MSKLIRIPYSKLPEFNTLTEKYQVRYRLKSDDGSKVSAWSPIYSIDPNFLYIQGDLVTPGTILIQKQSPSPSKAFVSVVWDGVGIYKDINNLIGKLDKYDFWFQYTENNGANPSNWIYGERIFTTSMNENVPATYTDSTGNTTRIPKWMRVEVYIPGTPISRYTDKTISITQSSTTVNITSNAIVTASAHGLETGDAIVYASSNVIGGLENDTVYWVRVSSSTTFHLHNHKSEALKSLNTIDLTTTGSETGTFTRYPFLLYKSIITTL